MPSLTQSLKSYLTAVSLSLWVSVSPQILSAQEYVREKVASLMYCQNTIDISSLTELYSVKSWDTFSSIAAKRWILYDDFLLVWNYANPWKQIDETIQVGDTFWIMKSGDEASMKLLQFKSQIQAKNNLDAANTLFSSGDIAELSTLYGFEITPKLPINLWMKRSNDVLLNMIALWYRIWPRNALPALEDTAACLHVIKQYLKYTMGFDSSVPLAFFDALRLEGQSAWVFPRKLEEIGYNRKYDMRKYFSQDFPSTRIAIVPDEKNSYLTWLLEQLEYLKDTTALSSFIPTLYQGTGFAQDVFRGNERNSHMFFNLWVGASNIFPASNIRNIDAKELSQWMPLSDFLVFLIKDYGQISRYQSLTKEEIHSALSLLSEKIELKVDGQLLWSDEILGKKEKRIFPTTQVQILWPMLMDGFQITPWENKNYIEARFVPAWIVYLWAFLPGTKGIFFPTGIISPPEQYMSSLPEGVTGDISNQVQIYKFFDLKQWQDARTQYMDLIAWELFHKRSAELSPEEIKKVEEEYALHSLGLQLLGYHALWGVSWNPGSTNINAPIPYLYLHTAEEKARLKNLYAQYIAERKKDFFRQIEESCEIGTPLYSDFIQILIFPGDTKTDIFQQIWHYLSARKSIYFDAFQSFDALQRDFFLEAIFWSQVVDWKLEAGKPQFISYQKIEKLLHDIQEMSYLELSWILSEDDRALFELFAGTSFIKELEAFTNINESYINASDFWDSSLEKILWLRELQNRFWRKGQKEIYRFLYENDLLWMVEYFTDVPQGGPRSVWDFQLRFENLYNPETALKTWPSKRDISQALDLILDPSSKFQDLIANIEKNFPYEIAQDRKKILKIQAELQKDLPDGKIIAEILKDLFRTNDARNIHIIGKIVSISLLQEKLKEHSENISEQLKSMGEDFDMRDQNQRERYAKYLLLINNMWEKNALYVIFENYLRRGLLFFQNQYPERGIVLAPESRKSEGVWGGKAFYSQSFLISDIESYIQEIWKIPEMKSIVDDLTNLQNKGFRSEDIYHFIKNSEIKTLYRAYGLDDSIFPTDIEWDNRAIFWYANEKHLLNRIPEPERTPFDFRGIFFALILAGYTGLSTLGWIGSIAHRWAISPFIRGNILIWKYFLKGLESFLRYQKEKKFENILEASFSEAALNAYLEKQKNPFDLILDSENKEYSDWYYSIQGDKWITSVQRYDSNLLLTNEKTHPLWAQYRDGVYSIIDPVTKIIRAKQEEILRQALSQEEEWFYPPYAIAAAE